MRRPLCPKCDRAIGVLKWRQHARRAVRVLCLVATVLALLPETAGSWSVVAIPSLSPFVDAASLLATRTFQPTMLIGLLVAVAAVARRRCFCRWVCPTGLCVSAASRLGRQLGRRCPKTPSFGPWIAWGSLGGALLCYPAFLWLDPLVMFSGMFGVCLQHLWPAAWAAALALPAAMILSLLLPGMWCRRVCPLGDLQDSLSHVGRMIATACRKKTSPHDDGGALTTETSLPADAQKHRRRQMLRAVLAASIGTLWAATAHAMRIAIRRPLRPPGARDDTSFVGLCVRCGNCIRICPSRIIEYDLGEHGIAGFLAPILRFREEYCRKDCGRCMEVCPSGALSRQLLDEKQRAIIGLARVDMNMCLLSDDRECGICRNRCPYDAISLVFSDSDYTLTPIIDPHKCPGCGACEVACPTNPVKAIRVFPLG